MPPKHTISGRVARSDDKRKYFLSGHIDLPIAHVRADGKIATDGTNAGELAIVLLDLVGPDHSHKLIDKFCDEVCTDGTPSRGRAVRSRSTDIPASVSSRGDILPESIDVKVSKSADEVLEKIFTRKENKSKKSKKKKTK